MEIKPPQPLNLDSPNPKEEWECWKETFELYSDIALAAKDDKHKVKVFKYLIREKGLDVYKTLAFPTAEESNRNLKEVLDAFDKKYADKKNEDVQRYLLFSTKQNTDETLENYITRLKIVAEKCELGDLKSSLTKTAILIGINDSVLRARLMRIDNLTLEKC